jgi:hypothetical protein
MLSMVIACLLVKSWGGFLTKLQQRCHILKVKLVVMYDENPYYKQYLARNLRTNVSNLESKSSTLHLNHPEGEVLKHDDTKVGNDYATD